MSASGAERRIWAILTAVIASVVAVGIWSMFDREERGSFPVIATLPEFSLIERSGRKISRDDLAGQVWVADFIFTHCSGVCPVLSNRMSQVQRALREEGLEARLVSISVDPARDTPEVLREYAERYAADPERWLFLTGKRDDLYDLIGEGFLLSVAERSPEEADGSGDLITHSDRFVLVDRQSRIRGYYHGTEEGTVEALVTDLAELLRQTS
jgi:protein SCO1/2